MKPSADYALFINGRLLSRPGALPDTHGATTGLRSLSDEELAKLRWYPVEYTCPACSAFVTYVFDKERQCIVAKRASDEPKKLVPRMYHHLDKLVHEIPSHPFVSSALGEEHLYNFQGQMFVWIFAAVLLSGGTIIPCRGKDEVLRLKQHSAEEARRVLEDFNLRNAEVSLRIAKEFEERIEQATTVEELEEGITEMDLGIRAAIVARGFKTGRD